MTAIPIDITQVESSCSRRTAVSICSGERVVELFEAYFGSHLSKFLGINGGLNNWRQG